MSNQGEKLIMENINSLLKRLDSDRDGRTSYLDFKYSISGDDEVGTLEEPLVKRQKGLYKPLDSPQHKASTLVGKYALTTSEILDESFKTPKKKLAVKDFAKERTTTSQKEYTIPIEEYKAKRVQDSGIASRFTSSQSPEVPPLKEDLYSKWEYELAKVFKSQLLIDSELESIKAQLNSQPDFILSNAFDYFDCKEMRSIALYELKKGLGRLGVKYKEESLMLLMKRYDLDMNGSLSYYEFIKMLSPIIASPLPVIKPPTTHNDEIEFEGTTKRILTDTFRSLIRTEEITETIRVKARTLELEEAFIKCDKDKKGFVTKKDLHEFMLRNDIDVKEINGALLMNRYDKDLDERITMREVM
jgi:Ca2+-binding EF-hand superfamily protein